MVSPLMALVARSVAASGLAEDCVVVSGGREYPTRATWFRREVENVETGVISTRSMIRFPAEDVPNKPVRGDCVRVDGRNLYVADAERVGPVIEADLTARQP